MSLKKECDDKHLQPKSKDLYFLQQQLKLPSSPTLQVRKRQMMAPNRPMGRQTATPKANQAPTKRYTSFAEDN